MASLSTLPVTRPTIEAPTLLRWWHLCSLDAPTVAVVWTVAFARAAHAAVPAWLVAVVGFSAWAFYIADRLLDARNARTPLRLRHHFHWRHRRILAPVAIVATAAALWLVLARMTMRAEARDSLLAAAAFAYFTGVHAYRPRRLLPKELLVALVFTAACATPVLSRLPYAGLSAILHFAPVLAIFVALAWLNCHAIECWESERSGDGKRRFLRRHAAILAALSLLTAGLFAMLPEPRLALLFAAAALSAALLGQLDRCQQQLTPIALRAAADLVLLTPLALVAMR